jgi:hypothetical protein
MAASRRLFPFLSIQLQGCFKIKEIRYRLMEHLKCAKCWLWVAVNVDEPPFVVERDSFDAVLLEDILRHGSDGGCKGQWARGKGLVIRAASIYNVRTRNERRGEGRGEGSIIYNVCSSADGRGRVGGGRWRGCSVFFCS